MAFAEIPLTPNTLTPIYPCLKCYNDKEIWAGIAWVLCKLSGTATPCTADNLAAESACFNCIQSERELLENVLKVLTDYGVDAGLITSNDITTLYDQIACHQCLDKFTLQKYSLKQLIDWLSAITLPT